MNPKLLIVLCLFISVFAIFEDQYGKNHMYSKRSSHTLSHIENIGRPIFAVSAESSKNEYYVATASNIIAKMQDGSIVWRRLLPNTNIIFELQFVSSHLLVHTDESISLWTSNGLLKWSQSFSNHAELQNLAIFNEE